MAQFWRPQLLVLSVLDLPPSENVNLAGVSHHGRALPSLQQRRLGEHLPTLDVVAVNLPRQRELVVDLYYST